jgi:hypothetical protein
MTLYLKPLTEVERVDVSYRGFCSLCSGDEEYFACSLDDVIGWLYEATANHVGERLNVTISIEAAP